ncbi:MAG: TerB family tellurite resistance protein [Candidatus Cloacimonadota bacterium]|nr:TerB family tellurite resistance protein [Candidatus Cloacimonadota bacterium]
MARWSTLEGSIYKFTQPETEEHFLKNFFENRAFIPKTDKEKEEYRDFSFVSSTMALLVYISDADGTISSKEKKIIMDELKFQLEHRHFEYEILQKQIDPKEMEILNSLFSKFKMEIEGGICDLEEIIRIINMIYQKNPFKRNFILRLCYYVGYADENLLFSEQNAIKDVADKLMISAEDQQRIKTEVKNELNLK